ncbi:ABC transporter permease [Arthrobacter sp. efr-133-TYG-118]|uniref:ABC transporter permease n=1 Tax=Arthrobacter sp. efr-133-TYG-118 TaxID=3040279 RepID=UPI00254A3387|nr:ABC transporter permease [Arthrobacter sp. efr-133-TYG-118]
MTDPTQVLAPEDRLDAFSASPGASEVLASKGAYEQLARPIMRRPTVILSLLMLSAAAAAAFWPHLFTQTDPLQTSPANVLQPPGTAGYLFGTDQVGRDLYSRIVYGAGPSLLAAMIAIAVSFVGGALLGLVAGYFGGKTDTAIMRFADVLLSFPTLLLAMAIVAVLGFGLVNVATAVGVVGIAGMARVMRSEVLRVSSQTYVEAAGVSGARWWTVLLRHVLPNSLGPIVVLAALEFGTAILSVSSLSFLGFGAPPPSPEWGSQIAVGRNYLVSAWWLTAIPGLILALVVISANRMSRAVDGEIKGATR